ncbi:MAG TPA: hypothetical protein VJ023_02575 [Pyrinomonadaceae bacterium]|nr:hypothetical protein [Pyrinomonadaceae bacterium]
MLTHRVNSISCFLIRPNRKPEHRRGHVQLIDATPSFKPLRKNLGKRNCELTPEDRKRIIGTFTACEESEQSKIFPNKAFGYWKITVERPLRLHSQFTRKAVEGLRYAAGDEGLRRELYSEFGQKLYEDFQSIKKEIEEILSTGSDQESDDEENAPNKASVLEKTRKKLLDPETWKRDKKLHEAARQLAEELGERLFEDHNEFRRVFDEAIKRLGIKLSASEKKLIVSAVSWRVEEAAPVIKTVHKPTKVEPDPLHGIYEVMVDGKPSMVEYETDSELRDTEQVPRLEEGGIEAFFRREVLPYVPDAWIAESKTQIGYEISFNRYFYKPKPLRTLEEIRRDIELLEKETEGLLEEVLVEVKTG